ncbi:cytochrome ubiquinol oxidase subunit I [Microtetraspora sp. NBRC 16547]|uniref:cytochrome ubiquinol oxidase subunit I n=1 Tax=Microtetraspora sp. NBRC 16547 TaxID=3030993 RepID=UPI0024A55C4D|nr:cytochrome ubiquinol oxidase subunit I [Microtetraspora sp. NBRC 16547]GLW96717.1 cytochrome ubiquinol oxidase subunit I [Microtetraspora sp. NBRC 16547]
MDALDLARWQFGVTTVYHFLFVPLTIGLGAFVAGLQTAWYRTGKDHYLTLTKFFGKLFLINFAMGVVTGIVQEFQFGMNWSEYSTFVGDVFGAPLALESLVAFFLESTFLGLWIFGWNRLPKRLHLAAIWAAAIGSNLSAYFILAANAWMKHPVGYEVVNGRARMTDLWAVLTNPTALAQIPHVVAAAFVVAGGFVLAVSGYRILRERGLGVTGRRTAEPATAGAGDGDGDATIPLRRRTDMWRTSLRGALVMTALAGVVVAGTGDLSGRLLHEQQPMKLAAAEGLTRDTAGAPFSIVPGVEVPNMLSLLAAHDPGATVQGVDDIQRRYEEQFGPADYTPNVPVVFWSFRVMIGFGMATVGLSVLGLWLTRKRRGGQPSGQRGRQRGRRHDSRTGEKRAAAPVPSWFARACVLALPLPMMAIIAGWLLSEIGRQPWTVQGELLTAASVSPGVSLAEVAISLSVFTVLYGVLAVAEAALLVRHVKAGPEQPPTIPDPTLTAADPDAARLTPTLMY